jgi:hypothetical protein
MFICRSCKKAKQLLLLTVSSPNFLKYFCEFRFQNNEHFTSLASVKLAEFGKLVNVNKLGCCIYKKDILINKTIYSINPCNTRQTYQTCQKSINKLFKLARWLIPNFAILIKLVLAKLCFLSDNSKLIKFDW